jgi:hypothetical protein
MKQELYSMERPLACWNGLERYAGEVLPSLTIILKTGGCRHNRCRMCSYRFERYTGGISVEKLLLSQLEWVVNHHPLSEVAIVKLYTSGSFFDSDEVPAGVAEEAARLFAGKLVDSSRIAAFIAEIDTGKYPTPLYVAMGLETTNDAIREKSIDKGFSWQDFRHAADNARKGGAGIKAYLLHKPLFLTEREALLDMEQSIREVAGIADIVSMNPCTVQKHTELEYYWKRGAYRPPYLWSVLAILLSTQVPVQCDPVGGGRARGPHNCGSCDYEIVRAIREYNLTADPHALSEIFETGCACKEEWERVLSLEKPYCMPLTR